LVRIRVLRPTAGILDGQSLSAFLPGVVYDVEAHLALQLITMGTAIEEASKVPAVGVDAFDIADAPPAIDGGVHVITRERRKVPRPGLPCPTCHGRSTGKTVDSPALEIHACRDCDRTFTVTKSENAGHYDLSPPGP
jgi:hypothetical protein